MVFNASFFNNSQLISVETEREGFRKNAAASSKRTDVIISFVIMELNSSSDKLGPKKYPLLNTSLINKKRGY